MRSTKIRVGITPSFERNINPLWRQALVRFCWPSTDSRVQNSTAHTSQRLQLSLKHGLPPQLCCHSPGILLCWRSWIRASLHSYRALHPPLWQRCSPARCYFRKYHFCNVPQCLTLLIFHISHATASGFLPLCFPPLSAVQTCVSTWCNDVYKTVWDGNQSHGVAHPNAQLGQWIYRLKSVQMAPIYFHLKTSWSWFCTCCSK